MYHEVFAGQLKPESVELYLLFIRELAGPELLDNNLVASEAISMLFEVTLKYIFIYSFRLPSVLIGKSL